MTPLMIRLPSDLFEVLQYYTADDIRAVIEKALSDPPSGAPLMGQLEQQLALRLPTELLERIDEVRSRCGADGVSEVSRSTWVRAALARKALGYVGKFR